MTKNQKLWIKYLNCAIACIIHADIAREMGDGARAARLEERNAHWSALCDEVEDKLSKLELDALDSRRRCRGWGW